MTDTQINQKMKLGVISQGITCPIIRKGDNLEDIVVSSVLSAVKTPSGYYNINDKDIVGITESIVARAQGNYATVDEIADWIVNYINSNPNKYTTINILHPIYSRNRFAIILRGIARAANRLKLGIVLEMPDKDAVGNDCRNHPFTKMNYDEYYMSICEEEGMSNTNVRACDLFAHADYDDFVIDCDLHGNYREFRDITLQDILSEKCEFGLLGCNKVDEETVKLFPNAKKAQKLVENINKKLKEITDKDVVVCVYGDGCFKDPVGGIWEFADPVSMPTYTHKEIIESTPNELKVKALADDKYKDLNGQELEKAIENEITNKENLMGKMDSQGTTPRLYRDLLASLMDLTSGSGDRCTPIVLIKNYL